MSGGTRIGARTRGRQERRLLSCDYPDQRFTIHATTLSLFMNRYFFKPELLDAELMTNSSGQGILRREACHKNMAKPCSLMLPYPEKRDRPRNVGHETKQLSTRTSNIRRSPHLTPPATDPTKPPLLLAAHSVMSLSQLATPVGLPSSPCPQDRKIPQIYPPKLPHPIPYACLPSP